MAVDIDKAGTDHPIFGKNDFFATWVISDRMETICPPEIPTSARKNGFPVPSIRRPPLIKMSSFATMIAPFTPFLSFLIAPGGPGVVFDYTIESLFFFG